MAAAQDLFATRRARLHDALDRVLPPETQHPARLHEAMRYATLGGKRLRALLCYAAGDALGLAPALLDSSACALELIHAYSLVHDDLPCMDDDDLRRGQPTVHVRYDQATAVLVGDALQALAFQALAADAQLAPQARLDMLACLARAAGSRGMVGGQAIDLASEGQQLNLAELEALHVHKTGALIHASVQLPCHAAGAVAHADRAALDHFGKNIGLAFQIQDDVLDIEGSTGALGKTAGKDEASHKSTYPSVMGIRAAKERATDLFAGARSALQRFGASAQGLHDLTDHIEGRKH